MSTTDFTSDLERVSQTYKRRLRELDAQVLNDLAREYHNVYQSAASQWTTLAKKIETAQEAGNDITPGWLYREGQLTRLANQVGRELDRFVADAHSRLTEAQNGAVSAALDYAQVVAETAMGVAVQGASLSAFWTQLNPETILNITANTAPGGPVYDVLKSLVPMGMSEARDVIINGVAQGSNPRAIANELHQTLGANLSRAQTIARTEVMRAQRETTLASYRDNSDIVTGYLWSSAQDEATCDECWALDGTFFETEIDPDAHINCRCTLEPVTKNWADLGYGEEASPDLPEELDPQGIADQLTRAGAEIDSATGEVTVYHFTSSANRDQIERIGEMTSSKMAPKAIYFTTRMDSKLATGDNVFVRLKIPLNKLALGTGGGGTGETYLRIVAPTRKLNVSQWLTSGPAKFAQLSDAQQRMILGPAKYRAYKQAAMQLRDVIGYKTSKVWGRSAYSRSLKEILGKSRARKFYTGRVA